MVAKRKVREDFNLETKYSVDVSNCTEEEKKEVQQAFFDAGLPWEYWGSVYRHLDFVQYTNTTSTGNVTSYCMYGDTTGDCNMTAKEFLDLVYEPDQQGHIHAELMAQYAEDAKSHAEPWEYWEIHSHNSVWHNLTGNPEWDIHSKYRRKPKTHIVHGVEIPDLRIKDFNAETTFVYCVDPLRTKFYAEHYPVTPETTNRFLKLGILYECTEEGKQAAILHAKAMLGVA